MQPIARWLVVLAAAACAVMGIEYGGTLVGEFATEGAIWIAAVIIVVASTLCPGWALRTPTLLEAIVVAGVSAALLHFANVAFLHWLLVRHSELSTEQEFSWFEPFYGTVVSGFGTVLSMIVAGLLAKTRSLGQKP